MGGTGEIRPMPCSEKSNLAGNCAGHLGTLISCERGMPLDEEKGSGR